MARQPVTAWAGLTIDGHPVGERLSCALQFSSDVRSVRQDRDLEFVAPSGGEAMVVFYQFRQGDDWWMKKYLGPVDRGARICGRAGQYEGTWQLN